MPFDYLQNAATEEETARWRALFEKDPAAATERIREQVKDAVARFARMERLMCACRADAKRRLTEWIGELTRMSETLPLPTSVFRSSADAHALGEVCRMIARLERSSPAVYAPQPSFERIAQEARACRIVREETVCRLGCAKQAAKGREEFYGALDALATSFDAACARFGGVAREFSAWQSAWFDFCRVRLSRFSKELSHAADLSHAGEHCDVASIRRLCGELRFAAESI